MHSSVADQGNLAKMPWNGYDSHVSRKTMAVPFIDLTRDVARYREEYLAVAARVLDSGVFSLGPEVEMFERAFAEFHGVKYAVGVNGGTLALYAAFLAAGIGAGDEVIMPANTFIATAEAAVMAGATPKFCDVDPDMNLLDLESCATLVTPKTKAVVPVHLYGLVADMDRVMAWAADRKLAVIEDAAQAHGARWKGRAAGTFGLAGCFSFYPTKNLGAFGEGGAVVTNDDALAERLRAVRLHGIMQVKYRHDIFGSNLKMEAFQAAFLRLKLSRLDALNERRRAIAGMYRIGLAGLPLSIPQDVGDRHVYHLFVVQPDRRDELRRRLKERGIGSGVHYPIPVHLQPSFARFGGKAGECPVAERMAGRILSLPMFPDLTDVEVAEVIEAVRASLA